MNFLNNLRLLGINDEQQQQVEGGNANQTNNTATPQPELSQDELRRRRLEKLGGGTGGGNTAASSTPSSLPVDAKPNPLVRPLATSPAAPTPSGASATIPAGASTAIPQQAFSQIFEQPNKKKEKKAHDIVDEALVYLLRVSLSPQSLVPDVHYLSQSARELQQISLSKDNVESVIYTRISMEPNDLLPRPTESPVRYLFGCIQRVEETNRRWPSASEHVIFTAPLLVSWLTTILAEPSISPQCCLAKSSSGPVPSVHHEVLDLLSNDRTRGKAFSVFEAVANESQRDNVKVANQIVPALLKIVNQRAKDSPLEPNENLFAVLCSFKSWAIEIAFMLGEEVKTNWENLDSSIITNPLAFLRGIHPKKRGARFELETIVGPILGAISCTIPSVMVNSFPRGGDPRARFDVINNTRTQLATRRNTIGDAFLNLCKANAHAREQVIAWLSLALELNSDRQKSQPPPGSVSSAGFALSVASVFLTLCWPFLEKYDPKQVGVLISEAPEFIASSAVYKDEERLFSTATDVASSSSTTIKSPKFVTQAFGLGLRAMALGPISIIEQLTMIRRQMSFMANHGNEQSEEYLALEQMLYATICETLEPDLFSKGLALYSLFSKWIMCIQLDFDPSKGEWWMCSTIPMHLEASTKLNRLPAHLFSDLTKFASAPTSMDLRVVDQGLIGNWESVLNFFIVCMSSAKFAPNTHVRAEMGDAVFSCFLPEVAKWDDTSAGSLMRTSPRENLIGTSHLACARLVPVLMQLYGDVEATSLYERFDHRHRIARVLRHLWSLESHRPSFRLFAKTSVDGGDECDFVKFAHGILNQTNSFVAESMSKLREIRKIQLERRNAETWEALPQNERELKLQMLEEDEKHVASSLKVANEVLNMLRYLLSDPEFVRAFTVRSLRGRLVDLFGSIIDTLAGNKGRDFKIDNAEKYNFFPKEMLTQVVQTVITCQDSLPDAMGISGYYNEQVFTKAGQLVLQWGMMTEQQAVMFFKFNSQCAQAQKDVQAMEQNLGEAPDEFLDPLTSDLMNDPVMLPTSKNIVDRDVIVRHLLNEKNDPFNRAPLDVSMLVPQPELKARIAKWKKGEGV